LEEHPQRVEIQRRFQLENAARNQETGKNQIQMSEKKKMKLWLKILLWVIAALVLIFVGLFTVGYFYYGRLIRSYLTEAVQKQSKGVYKAEIGEIYLDILNGNLRIRNLELTPDLARYAELSATDTLAPMLIALKIDKVRVKDFNIKRFINEKVIDIGGIRIVAPEVTLNRMRAAAHAKEKKSGDEMLDIDLPPGLGGLLIGEILLEDGKLTYNDHASDSLKTMSIPSCSIRISGISVMPGVHSGKLFNADDISLIVRGFELKPANGMNLLTFGEIGLSTGLQEVWVKKFHLIPQYSTHDYSRKLGFQTDRMDISVGEIRVSRLDLRSAILHGSLIAGRLDIDSLVLDNYRDKRVPRKPGFKPPMPQDGIRKLKSYLKIDTVTLKNGKATYSEQVNEEPGTIFFDKMEALFTGLTNDSILLQAGLVSELKGVAWLQGKGKLEANIRFKFGDKHNTFTFSAKMGPVDLREINPMLSKLIPGHVESGQITKMIIPEVQANDDVAYGSMLLYYTNMNVQMDKQKDDTWNTVKTGVINWVANDIIVRNNNPTESGKMTKGIIHFERHKDKGIINYLWKSAFSGIKSTIGINDKQQKEIKKAEKQEKKKEKQEKKKAKK
jgi:hypothetical protein